MNWLKKPSTTGGIIYLIVLGMLCFGLGLVVAGTWRTGVTVMGVAFGVACVARGLLPDERAGMLGVRRRFVDLVTMALCSGCFLVLAAAIRDRP